MNYITASLICPTAGGIVELLLQSAPLRGDSHLCLTFQYRWNGTTFLRKFKYEVSFCEQGEDAIGLLLYHYREREMNLCLLTALYNFLPDGQSPGSNEASASSSDKQTQQAEQAAQDIKVRFIYWDPRRGNPNLCVV